MSTKNLIFDLGGVVLDLGFERMVARFRELGIPHFEQFFTPEAQTQLFLDLELGLISPDHFYGGLRQLTGTSISDDDLRDAWNLILTDFDPARMSRLKALAQTHDLYLFSNTNQIHVDCFEDRCQAQLGKPLSHYFRALYYSSDLQLRKPDTASFTRVLGLAGIAACDSTFIDDNADNIAGAEAAGLATVHLVAPMTILDLEF